jgi:hypothetical protein
VIRPLPKGFQETRDIFLVRDSTKKMEAEQDFTFFRYADSIPIIFIFNGLQETPAAFSISLIARRFIVVLDDVVLSLCPP